MMFTTGQLAKRFRISVRTIRYYDQIGLVSPFEITESGKRFYTEEHCMRLQKIILLKTLNLSLEEIGQILSENSIEAILAAHKTALSLRREAIDQSISQATTLLNLHKMRGFLHWEELFSLTTSEKEKNNWLTYFTEAESSHLASVLPKLEEDDLGTTAWIQLLRRIDAYVEAGISPYSPIAIIALEDLEQLSVSLFEGNEELVDKFWSARRNPEQSNELGLVTIRPETISFIEEAFDFKQEQLIKQQSH